ncbi:hypothetical protein KJS94_10535 [Flavihumibacter rivuli]|uniref:hypothetical protein n=1 Tax=Flavihumibacter rivuli TaxID=2838156 RepID=UPI001BDEB272|nr:hypothetical protein [Flavihumibacter rivuli]ULQ55076.1 hypothetical protein KJS94_10535 [Flavihumibacter rivuli]
MKKNVILILLFFSTSIAFSQYHLNGVTFGFGAGYSILNDEPSSYSLSTDNNKNLMVQPLSKSSFVISSVVSVKLQKMGVSHENKLVKYKSEDKFEAIKWYERFSINASLNLIELSNSELSFNKSIDGGIGLGYFVSENVQFAVFYDIVTRRQLRDYIINDYLGKPIPNGTEYYNALDENDNNLYYNKTFTGTSFKIIISIGNKKPTTGS